MGPLFLILLTLSLKRFNRSSRQKLGDKMNAKNLHGYLPLFFANDETPPCSTEVVFPCSQLWGLQMEQPRRQRVLSVLRTVGQRSQGSVHRMLVILEWSAGQAPKMLVHVARGASPSLAS